MAYPTLNQMLDLIEVDAGRLDVGRRRQACVWRRERPDRVPILLGRSESRRMVDRVGPQYLRLCEHQLRAGWPVPEYERFDHFTLGEQFHDPEKMLIEALWDVVGWARTPSDAQLSLRPNFGVVLVPSVFGCGYAVGADNMPWVKDRPPLDTLLATGVEEIERRGLVPRVVEFIQLARAALRDHPHVRVFMPDLQGPMNVMFLLREQNAFYDMVDAPDRFGRLMELICEVYVRLTVALKRELGEPLDGGYHGAMYMEGGGARVVDDVSIMLSPGQYETFVLPYVRRCLAPFGGGWVHSCGDISHQLDFYLRTPEIRGINFGEPQYYDFEALLPRFAETGTFCYGGPVRSPNESVDDYLRRVARCVAGVEQTLIFQPRIEGLDMREGDWPPPVGMLERWERYSARGEG